jgi:hypothetical protein
MPILGTMAMTSQIVWKLLQLVLIAGHPDVESVCPLIHPARNSFDRFSELRTACSIRPELSLTIQGMSDWSSG